jgi:hypothetical protein
MSFFIPRQESLLRFEALRQEDAEDVGKVGVQVDHLICKFHEEITKINTETMQQWDQLGAVNEDWQSFLRQELVDASMRALRSIQYHSQVYRSGLIQELEREKESILSSFTRKYLEGSPLRSRLETLAFNKKRTSAKADAKCILQTQEYIDKLVCAHNKTMKGFLGFLTRIYQKSAS